MVKDGHVAKIPNGMSFEDAATLGTGVTIIGQTLYMTMKLPLPSQPTKLPISTLIYGGSSATGTLAIQYAKLFVFHPPSLKPADPWIVPVSKSLPQLVQRTSILSSHEVPMLYSITTTPTARQRSEPIPTTPCATSSTAFPRQRVSKSAPTHFLARVRKS